MSTLAPRLAPTLASSRTPGLTALARVGGVVLPLKPGTCRPSQGLCLRWGTAPQQPSPRPKRAPHSLIMTSGDRADPLVRLAVHCVSRRPGSLLSGSRPSSWGYRPPGCRQTTPVPRSMRGQRTRMQTELAVFVPTLRITPTMRSFCSALGSQRAMGSK